MVEALILYLISIICSLLIDQVNYSQVLYEVNKRGTYVISKLYDVAYKTVYETKGIERLIPIYNIIKPIYKGLTIPTTIDTFYDVLNEANILELMEPEKEKELKENPTIAKSLELTNKHEKQMNNYSRIVFNDLSVIFFDINDESITKIKRTIGPMASENGFTKFNRLNHAIELYKAFAETAYSAVLTKEEMEDLLKEQFTFDLSHIDDSISVEEFKEKIMKTLEEDPKDKAVEKDAKSIRRILKK